MTRHRFFATTARGLEPILSRELKGLGLAAVRQANGGAWFEGELEAAYRANLWLRTAQRVLLPIAETRCPDYDALYEGAVEVPWHDYLTTRHTLAVEAVCVSTLLDHSHHAALRIKDAIVDQLRQRLGARPDVDTRDPDVRIHAYIHGQTCQLSLDLSGDPLFMRRYRVQPTQAPLKETLAAAIILLSGWNRRSPFIDPFCGSGTLAIEAAMIARDRAPGRLRSFGFQRHPLYGDAEARTFHRLIEEADARLLPPDTVSIQASDRDPEAIAATWANARAAGMEDAIRIEERDARDLPPVDPGAFIVSNLPYGKRIGGTDESVEMLYRTLGHRLRRFPPHEAWLLASSPNFERAFGLPPRARHRLFNGPLETWLYGYRIGEMPKREERPRWDDKAKPGKAGKTPKQEKKLRR